MRSGTSWMVAVVLDERRAAGACFQQDTPDRATRCLLARHCRRGWSQKSLCHGALEMRLGGQCSVHKLTFECAVRSLVSKNCHPLGLCSVFEFDPTHGQKKSALLGSVQKEFLTRKPPQLPHFCADHCCHHLSESHSFIHPYIHTYIHTNIIMPTDKRTRRRRPEHVLLEKPTEKSVCGTASLTLSDAHPHPATVPNADDSDSLDLLDEMINETSARWKESIQSMTTTTMMHHSWNSLPTPRLEYAKSTRRSSTPQPPPPRRVPVSHVNVPVFASPPDDEITLDASMFGELR